jgi:hypothetical protein
MSFSFVFKNTSLLEFTIPLLVSSPSSSSYFDKKGRLTPCVAFAFGLYFFTFVLLGSRIP